MSRGDLIAIRNDLETQIDRVRENYEGLVSANRELQLRIKLLEETVERQGTTIKVLGNHHNKR